MSELKNWKKICEEKDRRIKELEGKFDLIVERLEERETRKREIAEEELEDFCLEMFHLHESEADGIKEAIEIVKGVMNERD